MPSVDDVLQNDDFIQPAQGSKNLVDASGEACDSVLLRQPDHVDSSCQMDAFPKEPPMGKGDQPKNNQLHSSLNALDLDEFNCGHSVSVEGVSRRGNYDIGKASHDERNASVVLMSNSCTPCPDLQINELSGKSNSDGKLCSLQPGNVPEIVDGPGNATSDSCCNALNKKMQFQHTTIEGDWHNLKDKDEPLKQESPLAVWVKWRGKWQTCIHCLKEDCPLQTLRAKPRHERKKYLSVFFPYTRTFGWADRQLVCSIDETPEPLAHGTHQSWLELAKDLSLPRRFVMQKLAISMLDISDKLHTEAVTQSARVASFWKEFAKESSCCKSYSELGMILFKLRRMILPTYIYSDWLMNSVHSWEQQCQSAKTAESIEVLTKELADSVVWKDVDELWNAPVQPELGSEWKTWKQEAMQLFTSSLPSCHVYPEVENPDSSVSFDCQRSAKRPKIEIDKTFVVQDESKHLEVKVNPVAEVINTQDVCTESLSSSTSVPPNVANMMIDTQEVIPQTIILSKQIPLNITSHCDKNFTQNAQCRNEDGNTCVLSSDGPRNKYRRCLAFMEARGKQCGRWACDGSDYCCVHGGSTSTNTNLLKEKSSKATMCMGTTTHGNKCKHRARHGSSFCKKHCDSSFSILESDLNSATVHLERKKEDTTYQDKFPHSNSECNNGFLSIQDKQNVLQEDLVQVRVGETLKAGNRLMNRHELHSALQVPVSIDTMQCIGSKSRSYDANDSCVENATRYTLYCEKHIPKFLKRSMSGRSMFISKEIFLDLLSCCSSREEKLHLHQACQIFYRYMRKKLSHDVMVSKVDHLNWILSEASKNVHVGEYLLKLASSERKKIDSFCDLYNDSNLSPNLLKSVNTSVVHEDVPSTTVKVMPIKCKACAEEFNDEKALGAHWMNIHKKEAKQLFRGYACAICMNSFTGKKILECHINDKHGMQFLQHSVLFRCKSCNSHFPNPEKLWEHVLSFHFVDLRLPIQLRYPLPPQSAMLKLGSVTCLEDNTNTKEMCTMRFSCGLCSMQFNLLSDLECHHQAVHLSSTFASHFPTKRAKQHAKTNRHHRPRLKLGLRPAFRSKNSSNMYMKKQFQASSSVIAARLQRQALASETSGLGKLAESQCSAIAESLFAEIRQTKPQPSNSEILSLARSACCAAYIHSNLVKIYGTPPENLYLRAARFCSELKIPISWHMEGFVCPRGCQTLKSSQMLTPLQPLSKDCNKPSISVSESIALDSKEADGYRPIISPAHRSRTDFFVLCDDISFGKESVPISCVIDNDLRHLVEVNDVGACHYQNEKVSLPWKGFSYVTRRLVDSSVRLDARGSQMGCSCRNKKCYSGECDHVYLLNNDYENAKDVNGSSMLGRFPYDERGQIRLKKGLPVYECNSMCLCGKMCQNRVVQNGMKVKLEIFRTEKKGWAVRAREAISRGTFVCEYIGAVIGATGADGEAQRHASSNCKFLFDISAIANELGLLTETQAAYLIDSTKYGNVSRFINHSCSPNLACYLVLIESMEWQFAHVGLFASQDIEEGEELVFDYRPTVPRGNGFPCYCGSSNCCGFL